MKYLFLLLLFSTKIMALDVPRLTSPVEDKANILNSNEKSEIVNILHDLNDRGLIQMNVLTIPSLEGEVLEEYSIKVAEKWKLGTEKKDNGVILLLAMEERKIRIEVGNGIEGEITDYLSSRIIDKMKDHMRSGNNVKAIKIAISNIQTAMEENLPVNIAIRVENDRLEAIRSEKVQAEQVQEYELQKVQDEKDEQKRAKQFELYFPIFILVLSGIIVFFSFNQGKIEKLNKLIYDVNLKIKDTNEKFNMTKAVHARMKVDHAKYNFVIEKEEVFSLKNKNNKLRNEIRTMKEYLGVK